MATTSWDDKALGERLVVFRCPHNKSFLWWPALLFDTHKQALPRMGKDKMLNSFPTLRLRLQCQFLAEMGNHKPPKPLVQLLGGGSRKCWYPLESIDDTQIKRDLEYFLECAGGQSIPDDLQATFDQAHDEAVELLEEAVTVVQQREELEAASSTINPAVSDETPRQEAVQQSEKSPAQQKDDDDDSVLPPPPDDNDDDEAEQQDEPESGVKHHPSPILPDDTFEEAWEKMHADGWNFVCLHETQQELYCPPMAYADAAGNLPSYSPTEVIDYMRSEWGWKGEPPSPPKPPPRRRVSHAEDRTVISSNSTIATNWTPEVRPRLPDPGAPLSSSSDESSYAGSEKYDCNVLWQRLRKRGWYAVKARGLHDWYYMKPGVTRETGVVGVNMFLNLAAVVAHCKEQDGYKETDDEEDDRRLEDMPRRRLNVEEQVRISKTTTKRSKPKRQPTNRKAPAKKKQPVASSQKRGQSSKPKTLPKKRKNSQAHKKDSQGLPPNEEQVVPILRKIGIRRTENGEFVVPFVKVDDKELVCECGRGLGILFQLYGIPNKKKLSFNEKKKLERWACFVNVPLAHKDIPEWLESNEIPTTNRQLRSILSHLGFEVFGGRIYLPGCPHTGRKHGVHYFEEAELETKFRAFVRSTLKLTAQIDEGEESSDDDSSTMSQLSSATQRTVVLLRLWAAKDEADFPDFRGLRSDSDILKSLQAVKPMEFFTVTPVEALSKAKPTSETDEEDTDIDNDPVSMITPPPPKKSRRDNRAWYLVMDPPDFTTVWPILQQIGWEGDDATGFTHPNLPNSHFDSICKVRFYMCSQSVPNVDRFKIDLSPEQCQLLHRWCVCVNLEWCWPELKDAKRLSEQQALIILYMLGFQTTGSGFVRPGADTLDRKNREPIPSYHDLLVFLRSSEQWSVECEGVPRVGPQSKHPKVSKNKMVSLLLTAFLVDEKLPTFATPKKTVPPRRQRKRRQLSEADASQKDTAKTSDSSSEATKEATQDVPAAVHDEESGAQVEGLGTSQDSDTHEPMDTDDEVVPSTENGNAAESEMDFGESDAIETRDASSTAATNKDKTEDVPVAHAEGSGISQGSSLNLATASSQAGMALAENSSDTEEIKTSGESAGSKALVESLKNREGGSLEATAAEQQGVASAENSTGIMPEESRMDVEVDTEEIKTPGEPAGAKALAEPLKIRDNAQMDAQETSEKEPTAGHRSGGSVAATSTGNNEENLISTNASYAMSTEHSEMEVDEGETGTIVEKAFNAQGSAQMEVQQVKAAGFKETESGSLAEDLDGVTELNNTAENVKAIASSKNEDAESESLGEIQVDPNPAGANPNSISGFPFLTQPDDDDEGTENELDDTASDSGDCCYTPRPFSFRCPPLSSSRTQPTAPNSPAASVGSLRENIVQSINEDLSDEDMDSSGFLLTQE